MFNARGQFSLDSAFPRSNDWRCHQWSRDGPTPMPPSDQVRFPASGPLPCSAGPALPSSKEGGSEARWFAETVEPHEPLLRAYLLRRFPSLPDHDDVIQETYTRLFRARQVGRLTYAKAFLFTAARNVAIDMYRRRRTSNHETISEITELPVLDTGPGVVEAIDRQQRLDLLAEAVSALPERCRQVMMLRHLDGLSYKEIAQRLGISPETVKVHMIKGVRACVGLFRRHGLLEASAPVPREDSR